MITLTNAPVVKSVLGGSATVSYNKLVLSAINYDSVNMLINATVRLTSTAEPSMQPVAGTLKINTQTAVLTIEVQQLDFYRQIVLTGPQNTSVQSIITNAQNSLEAGLISVGVVAGTQAPGA
jgi:hypothetical protein